MHDFLLTAVGVQSLILLCDSLPRLPFSAGRIDCEASVLASRGSCCYRMQRKSNRLSGFAET